MPDGFLSEPIGVELLSGFEKFDLENTASWSHVELYAAALGWEINLPFLKAVLVLSYYFPGVYAALLDGLRSGRLDAIAGTDEFAGCVFKVWSEKRRWGVWHEIWDAAPWLAKIDVSRFNMDTAVKAARKYRLLRALDERFPMLLVRFYAARQFELHGDDYRFELWLRKRVAARAMIPGGPWKSVLAAMERDFWKMNRTAMFMS